MAEEKNNVPKIRFREFTGKNANAWELRKLGDIVGRRSKTAVSSNKLPSVEYDDVIPEMGILNKDITQKAQFKKGIIFKESNVLFGKLRPYLKNWLLPDFNGVAVGDWWVLYSDNLNSSFIYYLIQTPKFYFSSNQSSGSKMPRADWKNVSNTLFYFPINKYEQEQLGNFFKNLDNLITLHQRKVDEYKTLKKTMLSKMFPKNSEKYPEIRFSGFTDAWEQRKLGEVGKFKSGVVFPNEEQGGEEGIPFFKISDMNSLGNENEMISSNNYVTDEQIARKSWTVITAVPAIVFAKVGAAIMLNRKRIIRIPFLIDNNTMAYCFSSSWNISFGKSLFETINLPKYAQVGALPSYNSSDIENIGIKIPIKITEQQKIGSFFKHLDELITLHQCRCNAKNFLSSI